MNISPYKATIYTIGAKATTYMLGGKGDTPRESYKALSKIVQKISKENNASDTIYKATLIFNPLCMAKV